MSHVALIPARKGSVRLPNKNFLPFTDRDDLTSLALRVAIELEKFDEIILSTDNSQYISYILHHDLFKQAVTPILRPKSLATAEATTQSVINHVFNTTPARYWDGYRMPNYLTLLQPTSPFRLKKTWRDCYDLLHSPEHDLDCVCTLRGLPYITINRRRDSVDDSPWKVTGSNIRRKPDRFACTGGFYVLSLARLGADSISFPPNARIGGIVVDDPLELIDIDTEADFKMAQAIIKGPTSLDYLGL